MISSLVEGWIKKFCGKFIRDFDSSNVEVTLTGTIELHKIELRVEEFSSYSLPYHPAFVYIDKLSLDLPVLLSTQFSLTAKDTLIIVQKGDDVSELDTFTAQKTLQIILGVWYLNLTNTMKAMESSSASGGGVSAVELEYGFKLSDRLSLTFENIHFRLEEDYYKCHFPFKKDPRSSSIEEDGQGIVFEKPTVLGLITSRAYLNPPTSKDISDDSALGEQSVWSNGGHASRDRSISVNKILRMEGLSVYCGKEFSAIPVKHDERVRTQKKRLDKGIDSTSTRVDDSVILGGDDGDSGADDCSSEASTDDGNNESCVDGEEDRGGDDDDDEDYDGDISDTDKGADEILALGADGYPTTAYLEYLARRRPAEAEMLQSFSLTVRASVVYQTDNQVFGPLRMHMKVGGADMRLNDAQTTYLSELVLFLREYIPSLQRKCMRGCLTCSGSGLRTIDGEGRKTVDVSRRARLRWRLIRNSIRKDWHGYASALPEGTLRWRAWFTQWRLCARYIALRELLIFHVGFEGDYSAAPTPFKLYETLLMDHSELSASATSEQADGDAGKAARQTHGSPRLTKAWRGSGAIAEGVVRVAETLVRAKIAGPTPGQGSMDGTGSATENTSSAVSGKDHEEEKLDEETGISFEEICTSGSTAALMLSSRTVRALYAMQLELDALLPPHAVAFCRFWADDRFRRQRDKARQMNAALAGSQQEEDGGFGEANAALPGGTKAVLLVGVVDAVNLTAGSLGMSRLEASCVLRTHRFGRETGGKGEANNRETLSDCSTMHTRVRSAKVGAGTGTALCAWGQIFEVELDEERRPAAMCDLEVECNCRGVFSPAYGNLVAPLDVIMGGERYGGDVAEALSQAREREAGIPSGEVAEYLARAQPAFEGALNTLHANLDTDRTCVYALGVEPKVRDMRRRADASAMRSPSGKAVSVRLFSQVVVGTAAAIADRKSKLQQMASSAIGERREVVAREQAMAGRSGVDEDDDDDDMFVLDPTSLTIQHLRLTMEVEEGSHLSLTQSALYAAPSSLVESGKRAGLDVAELKPVPFLKATLGGVRVQIDASNNPWIAEGHVRVPRATVELAAPETEGGTSGRLQPVLMLPPSTFSLSLTQTSTTGRLLGSWAPSWGGSSLDESCFDWRAAGTLGPFSVSIKPPSGAEASHKDEYTSSEVVWQSYRPLAHLFRPAPGLFRGWSRGIFSPKVGSEDGSTPVSMTPEAALRLGDHYTTFPQFKNSLCKVAASTTVPRPEGEQGSMDMTATAPLAPQITGLGLYTQSRQMSVDLKFAPSRSSLVLGTSPGHNPLGTNPGHNPLGTHGAAGEDELAQEERRPAAIWGMFGGGGGAPVDRNGLSREPENRVSALEKLHASQLERERQEHAAMVAELREEIAALRGELGRGRADA
jgi:hypothetical protein